MSYEDALSERLSNVSKIYYGQYLYDAQNLSSGVLYHEDNIGRWWGAESKFVYTGFNGHQLVYGAEIRDDFQQDFIFPTNKVENSNYMASLYLQDEYRWSEQWAVNAGLRGDYGGKNANNLSPRLALLYSPQLGLEIKASYATAFRRANAFEKYYDDGSTQLANPDLKKEQVKAYELVVDYQPDAKSKLMGSLYYYKTEDAIQINELVALPGFTQANNADAMFRTRGMDVEYERRFTPTSRIRANYAWQYSTQASREWMVNSPKNLAKFNYAQDLFDQQLNLGLELQYVGKRLTEQRATLGSYSVVNLTMYNNTWFKNTTLSASVKNLFDRQYAVPASDYSTPDRFEQDGARAWVQVTYDLK